MMVTFVSECEKKALNRTRRVLDSFAGRIGSGTWQTVITAEGLQAVKKLLRKTATKNTAVSCHWIRSRRRTELMWIVGNRRKFNSQGFVPVNFTEAVSSQFADEGRWKTLRLIQHAAVIAGLFHDFGKANQLFQNKINPDVITDFLFEPYRHEWVSLRQFQAFVGDKRDMEWLDALADINPNGLKPCFCDGPGRDVNKTNHPILNLPPFASLVAWIIITHHRLPLLPAWEENINANTAFSHIDQWLEEGFEAVWNSYRCKDVDQQGRIEENWTFAENALPCHSSHWRAKACIEASEAKEALSVWLDDKDQDFINGYLFTSHLSRLCVMLADHHYSAQKQVTQKWRNAHYKVYANTYRKKDRRKGFKQQLDEHLIGVAHHAGKIVTALPRLNSRLESLPDNNEPLTRSVEKEYKKNFGWQDKARKLAEKLGKDTLTQGFFGINMASTGKGKTIANAKIMYALGKQTGRIRFSVALGLRSLTLQTGKEFQGHMELSDKELAIAVGGTAVKQLFDNEYTTERPKEALESSGSESDQEVVDDELFVHYSGPTAEHSLSEWTKENERLEKLLCAPVLVSTIDHLVPATEGTRGGKQIGPMLRLLTSDLVLDEPDDFALGDLPALCRLVHWAGMLGARVLLSTATMPPALAHALFQSYRTGWAQYAKANIQNWNGAICCAWFDEFGASHPDNRLIANLNELKNQHSRFVKVRLNKLTYPGPKRLGKIITVENQNEPTIPASLAETIHTNMKTLHRQHHVRHDGKKVSIGLVRMANINPLVAVARELIKLNAPKDTCIHYCVYHSRFPLAIRSYIEQKLDRILKRKEEDDLWQHPEINDALQNYPDINNHLFVILASPVAEVGRDHDYDWAIVEPSSMRSIIQLAGRVLRHRDEVPDTPNILLLNQNYKALHGKKVCFTRPGFESGEIRMASHELLNILNEEQYRAIDAKPRITDYKPKNDRYRNNLNALEHKALDWHLFSGPKKAKVWWESQPYWCGEVQRQQRFRQSDKDEAYFLCVKDEYTPPYWQWLNEHVYPPKMGDVTHIAFAKEPERGRNSYFWLDLDEFTIYSELSESFGLALSGVSRRFGELRVTEYGHSQHQDYCYHKNLGLYQELGD